MNVKPYLIAVDREYVRDAQVANTQDSDPSGDDWSDISGDLILGTFDGADMNDAIDKAAEKHGLARECLVAYPLS